MHDDMLDSFEEATVSLLDVAVTGDVVLAEQALRLKVPSTPAQWVMGFANYRIEHYQIVGWRQLHA